MQTGWWCAECRRLCGSSVMGARDRLRELGEASAAAPNVVNITTTRYKDIQIPSGNTAIAQAAEPNKSLWYGSGFIISTDGYVVTNKHVVHNEIDFKVSLSDGMQFPLDLIGKLIAAILR
jgi:S1-C subfamily serine protease